MGTLARLVLVITKFAFGGSWIEKRRTYGKMACVPEGEGMKIMWSSVVTPKGGNNAGRSVWHDFWSKRLAEEWYWSVKEFAPACSVCNNWEGIV